MRLVPCLAASVALLASGCAHFECTAHGGHEVRALTTEHFVITSDLPADAHRAEAERLELLWDTFATFFEADVPEASIPVVVLRDESDVDAFAPGYSGFVVRSDPEVLVVGAPAPEGGTNINAHELTHLVSAYLLPRQPRWVAEGLGALFEDATFKDARTVRMGRWNAGRAEEAFIIGVATLDELNGWGGLRFDDSERHLYASAWAWIHYLANHDEGRLRRLFTELKGPKPTSQVLAEVFPPADAARLHAEVKAYLADARFRGWETRLSRTPTVRAQRVLAPWEVHLLRSRLSLRDDGAEARELAQVLALAPTPRPPAVDVVEAQLQHADLAPLVTRHPESSAVLVAAHAAQVPLPREVVLAAVAKDGTNASLLLVAADVAMGAGDVAGAEAMASRGFALAPWSAHLAAQLASAALFAGRCDEALRRLSVLEALVPERPSEARVKGLARLRQAVAECRQNGVTPAGTSP